MSNKQTEALKLALAGLVKASRYGFGEFEEEKSAISSAIQHLEMAEQPAQQEPVACKTLCELCIKRGYIFCANAAQTAPIPSPQPAHESAYQRGYMDGIAKGLRMEQPAQQQQEQEPVITKNEKGLTLHVGWDDLPAGTKLYTSPQSKPWVGLTSDEIAALKTLHGANRERTAIEMAFAVQAKLMEKNT